MAIRASPLVGQLRRLIRSFFTVAKNDSATALSNAEPFDPIDVSMPASRRWFDRECRSSREGEAANASIRLSFFVPAGAFGAAEEDARPAWIR
jgi:hypothetical protein